jgi:hypothetical protein
LTTERPGGVTAAATMVTAAAAKASSRACRRGQVTGSRSPYAVRTISHVRRRASYSPGISMR